MKTSHKTRFLGFTLVEMLVVIALVGILSSVLAMVILHVRRLSLQVACQENERQIGVALNKIMLNNNGRYPTLLDSDGIPWWAHVAMETDSAASASIDTDGNASTGLQLPVQLPSQMDIFHCRSAPALENSPDEGNMATRVTNLFNTISYGLNCDVRRYDGSVSDYRGDLYTSSGMADSGTAGSLTDDDVAWTGGEYAGQQIELLSGGAAGEFRDITGNTGDTISFNPAFSSDPSSGTKYYVHAEVALESGTISVDSTNTKTLTDSTKSWTNDEHKYKWVVMTSGPSSGDRRFIIGNTGNTLYFDPGFSKGLNPLDSLVTGLTFEIWNPNYPDLLNRPRSTQLEDGYPDVFYYTEIKQPSEFILISEANAGDLDLDYDGTNEQTGGRIAMQASEEDETKDDVRERAPIVGRHDGWANVLFADMHVEPMQVDGDHWTKNINLNTPLWTLPAD